jgi:hypothetical protein
LKGADREDWLVDAGMRGNDAYYEKAGYKGVPLENLSQLHPYPDKPVQQSDSLIRADATLTQLLPTVDEDDGDDDDDGMETQLNGPSPNRHLSLDPSSSSTLCSSPFLPENREKDATAIANTSSMRSPLRDNHLQLSFLGSSFASQMTLANTQELQRLKSLDDALSKELADIDRQLAVESAAQDQQRRKEEPDTLALLDEIEFPSTPDFLKSVLKTVQQCWSGGKQLQLQLQLNTDLSSAASRPSIGTRRCLVRAFPEKTPVPDLRICSDGSKRPIRSDACSTPVPKEKNTRKINVKPSTSRTKTTKPGMSTPTLTITTTSINGDRLVQLTRWSDKFSIAVHPQFIPGAVNLLVLPTNAGLMVQKRTMKYFEALLYPETCRVVSFDWMVACLSAGRVVDVERFVVKGDAHGYRPAPSRTDSVMQTLFASHRFYLYGQFMQPPADQLLHLLQAAGAQIIGSVEELARERSGKRRQGSQSMSMSYSNSSFTEGSGSSNGATVLVLCDGSVQTTFEEDAQLIRKFPIVGPLWVMNCISAGRLIDRRPYLVL